MGNSHGTWSADEAMRYEDFAERSFSWRYIEEPALCSLIKGHISQWTTALDLGCGGGRIIRLLQSLGIQGKAIFGIDNDSTLINVAREKFPDVNFVHHELTDSPYRGVPDRINVATAHFVLQYLTREEIRICLAEVRRLLAPDGIVAIGLPHPVRVAQQAGASYFARDHHDLPAPWGGTAISSGLTVSDYVNLLIQLGFRIRRLEEPELSTEGQREVGANAYSVGPTRLMLLAQVAADESHDDLRNGSLQPRLIG